MEALGVEEDQLKDAIKPRVGMEFRSPEEAFKMYNDYACRVGFSVRKQAQTKNKHGVSSMRYVCSKEGFSTRQKKIAMPIGSESNPRTPEKLKGMTRTGCGASFRMKIVKGGIWKVSVFVEDHNHELILSPSKKRNLRSHKFMSIDDKKNIRNMHAQNIGSSQMMELLALEHGGKQNVRFKRKDISNLIAGDNRKLIGIDVHTTLMYFQKRQEEDPEFFHSIEADEDGVVKNIFWVDGRARRTYQEFGDVVTFDTTYQTNKYNMPFAPFIGVNHHRQSILFGMALLKCETAENFCWLFKTWLEAMYDKHPISIITDQCPAMRKAIELVFPRTIHRCCQWHVMRKARDHFGQLYKDIGGFKDELSAVINRSLTVSDFEKRWTTMVNKYNLLDNNYLKVMYKNRMQWVPAYFRATFFADMSTTQRSESMNALFKLLVDNHKSVYQFVLQIEKMIESIWQRESDEDLKCINEMPHLWSKYKMEFKARQVYTRKVFSLFKENVQDSLLGDVTEIERDVSYQVDISYDPEIQKYVPKSYIVDVDKERCQVSCNCKGYEFEGILCPHAIKVMHHVKMTHLPDHYIMKRWTKGANASVKRSASERGMDPGETAELQALRVASLKSDWMELVKIGAVSSDGFSCLKEVIASGKEKLFAIVGKQTQGGVVPSLGGDKGEGSENDQVQNRPMFLDLHDSHCKGRRKTVTRIVPASMMNAKKMRTCSVCKKKAGHNSRTCPMLNSQGPNKGKETTYEDSEYEDHDEDEDEEMSKDEEDEDINL
ncbi:protein FAR1-RELATED SEQUENCE 5-like isoform X2 [Carex rostrata]